jgi:hypothetical protein
VGEERRDPWREAAYSQRADDRLRRLRHLAHTIPVEAVRLHQRQELLHPRHTILGLEVQERPEGAVAFGRCRRNEPRQKLLD